jgi:hypothetical protein
MNGVALDALDPVEHLTFEVIRRAGCWIVGFGPRALYGCGGALRAAAGCQREESQ